MDLENIIGTIMAVELITFFAKECYLYEKDINYQTPYTDEEKTYARFLKLPLPLDFIYMGYKKLTVGNRAELNTGTD
jgi:hypothetical protein